MIRHFDNAFNCLKYLTALAQDEYWQRCVFRGESAPFPSRLPSAARADNELTLRRISYSAALSAYVWDVFISPLVKKTSFGPMLGDDLLLSSDMLGRAYGEGYAQFNWRIQSIFQHYGLPTQWLDLTSNPKVAILFASWDASQQQLLLDGTGYVYFVSLSSLASSGASPLIDLADSSDILAAILGVTSERPRAQSALSIRCGWNMEQMVRTSSFFECVSFQRTPELSILDPSQCFPPEPLINIIKEWDERYTELVRTDPERAIVWENHPLNT